MFYCDICRKKKKWPESPVSSYGTCEVCGKKALCFDKASRELPKPPYVPQEECMSATFYLSNGQKASVRWTNGPPYLSIGYDPPEPSADRVGVQVAALKKLTDEQRKEVFDQFCCHCGSDDPLCRCWDDS